MGKGETSQQPCIGKGSFFETRHVQGKYDEKPCMGKSWCRNSAASGPLLAEEFSLKHFRFDTPENVMLWMITKEYFVENLQIKTNWIWRINHKETVWGGCVDEGCRWGGGETW